MYADQRYLLTWQSRRCNVILEEEASPEDLLLAVWQVSNVSEVVLCGVHVLLRLRRKTRLDSPVEVYPHPKELPSTCSGILHLCTAEVVLQAAWLDHRGVVDATQRDLQASIDAVKKQGAAFIHDLGRGGWQVGNVTIRTGQVRFKRHRNPDVGPVAQ